MAEVSFSQLIHAEQIGDTAGATPGKNQGILKADGKEYSIFLFADSKSVSEAAFEFLQGANQQERPPELLLDFEFIYITAEMIDIECEIAQLFHDLSKEEPCKDEGFIAKSPQNRADGKEKQPGDKPILRSEPQGRSHSGAQTRSNQPAKQEVYSSLFSLARSFNTSLAETKQKKDAERQHETHPQGREEGRPVVSTHIATLHEKARAQENHFDRDGNGKQEKHKEKDDEGKEGFSQNQEQKKNRGSSKHQDKKKKVISVGNVQAARSQESGQKAAGLQANQGSQKGSTASQSVGSVDNIYIRFMALMARILGQAELEAHQLYLRVKERTDTIDILTLLITKINSEKGAIDWTNNEEMKKLIDKAKALGAEIPDGKYQWSEEEKKLLKENIQMRKDSLEKITQLERTDMQRYLQEASQCHQARSNVLKLLKEVMDTINANMRP